MTLLNVYQILHNKLHNIICPLSFVSLKYSQLFDLIFSIHTILRTSSEIAFVLIVRCLTIIALMIQERKHKIYGLDMENLQILI